MDKIEIIDISKEEMASYISRAFSAGFVKRMIEQEDTLALSTDLFQKFGNILQAYASATGDLSNESIFFLTKNLREHKDILRQPYDEKVKLSAEQIYFGKYVMPKIIEIYAKKMNINQPLSLHDSCKILTAVETNSKNNCFKTHSFNGSLLSRIKENGLDINKEMFVEEFNILSLAGMTQPYQKGNLLFCELSKASFGYALRAPEKLIMSRQYGSAQKNNQSINEFLTQEIRDNLSQNTNLSDADKQKIYTAGKKIIDFYFNDNNKSVIALIKEPCRSVEPRKYENILGYQLSYSPFYKQLTDFLDANKDSQMKEYYEKAVEKFKTNHDISKIYDFSDEFNKKYPQSDIFKKATEVFMIKNMTEFGLNNFTYNGNADGYIIDGGKMSRDQFALAEFDNPIDVYVRHYKKRSEINDKLAILRTKIKHTIGGISDNLEKKKIIASFKILSNKLFGKAKE